MASGTVNGRTQKRKRNKWVRRILIVFWGGLGGAIGLFALLLGLVALGVFGKLPETEELENPRSFLASEIYSVDGEPLGTFFKENRSRVVYEQISPNVIDALISTEDVRFHRHAGVDRKSLLRVVFKTIFLGQSESGGGSTITQQLAKNLFPRKGIKSKLDLGIRKLKEWVIATRLEKRYTKEEILTMYLNTVEFINNAFGIKTASKVYFNTTPDSLEIQHAATLVGMVKNPTQFNPIRFPDTTLHRRNVVMHQMVKYGKLDRADYDSLKLLPLGIDYQVVDHNIGLAPYLREYIRTAMTAEPPKRKDFSSKAAYDRSVKEWNRQTEEDPLLGWLDRNRKPNGDKYDIYKDGLKIHLTIDSRMQQYAEDAVAEHLTNWQDVFNKHWDNYHKDPWNWNRWHPRYQPEFMERAMKNTDRYRSLKRAGVTQDSIQLVFEEKIPMRVFSWKGGEDRQIDTVMSPLDSIRYYKFFLQAGFTAVDPFTGEVLAWVGGIDHRYWKLDHVRNTKRQVGSTFKPYVYTKAVEDIHYSPCHKFPNTPYTVEGKQGAPDWTPKNSSRYKDGQMVELQDALAHSINRITARLMHEVGPSNVINLLQQMGISDSLYPHHSISLGTCDLSVYQMAGAYTAYANRGLFTQPIVVSKIENKYGVELESFEARQVEAFDWQTAYVMLNFLLKVKQIGTANRLGRYGFGNIAMGGKTGTTQDNSDGWFMGVTPQLVAGTWVGCDDPVISFRSTAYGQGAAMALPIYALFMQRVFADGDLGFDRDATFEKPNKRLTIEMDCGVYEDANYDPYRDSMDIVW